MTDLHWQALPSLDNGYTVFAHMLGSHNPSMVGPLWAGHDSQTGMGPCPTGQWRVREVILDVHPQAVPANTSLGLYQLETGPYLLSTIQRLPGTDVEGQPLPDSTVPLRTIQVRD
jgi:hypothetical protein